MELREGIVFKYVEYACCVARRCRRCVTIRSLLLESTPTSRRRCRQCSINTDSRLILIQPVVAVSTAQATLWSAGSCL